MKIIKFIMLILFIFVLSGCGKDETPKISKEDIWNNVVNKEWSNDDVMEGSGLYFTEEEGISYGAFMIYNSRAKVTSYYKSLVKISDEGKILMSIPQAYLNAYIINDGASDKDLIDMSMTLEGDFLLFGQYKYKYQKDLNTYQTIDWDLASDLETTKPVEGDPDMTEEELINICLDKLFTVTDPNEMDALMKQVDELSPEESYKAEELLSFGYPQISTEKGLKSLLGDRLHIRIRQAAQRGQFIVEIKDVKLAKSFTEEADDSVLKTNKTVGYDYEANLLLNFIETGEEETRIMLGTIHVIEIEDIWKIDLFGIKNLENILN